MCRADRPHSYGSGARPAWLRGLLLVLLGEKVIQHIVVTLAFYFNWRDIAATVVVSPDVLMVLGGMVAVVFAFSLWALWTQRPWAIDLVIGLALFDIIGEFVAQGRIGITLTVSFLVALLLLILALLYRRRTEKRVAGGDS